MPRPRWVPLGTFDLIPGQNHRVELRNANLSQTAIADAIRYEWVGESRDVMADSVRFVRNDAQAVHYVLWDHLFTPQKLVDGNRAVVSGAVVWDAAFTPYGAEESLLGSAVMKLRLPGQYADEETGRGGASSLTHPLYYNYHRDYDPATGRYVQVDPIGLAGGNNPYRYASASPRVYVDPKGLFEFRTRPLRGLPFKQPIGESNAGIEHEHGFYENGDNIGYGPDGIGPDDPELLDTYGPRKGPYYDDEIMRKAEKN